MATVKRKAAPRKSREDRSSALTASARSQDAAVRSVIPDDVLRNLDNNRRRTSRVPLDAVPTDSRFAC